MAAKPAKVTSLNEAVNVADLQNQISRLTERVEALESVAAAQRRRQAATVAAKLKQSPEQLAMLKEIVDMAQESE